MRVLAPKIVMELAVKADVDPRTIRRLIAGIAGRPNRISERARQVILAAGYQIPPVKVPKAKASDTAKAQS